MRQGFSQLVELRRRSVHFQPDQIGNCERLREERADVVQMSEQAFRIRVGFSTENFIAIDGELIEKILLLACSSRDEPRKRRRENLKLSRMDFEVRMQADEIRKRLHPPSVPCAAISVEH